MANCPVCSGPLLDDIGLIECPKCGAALFVEFDGTVQVRDEIPSLSAAKTGALNKPAEKDVQGPEGFEFSNFKVPTLEPNVANAPTSAGLTSAAHRTSVTTAQRTALTELVRGLPENAGTSTLPLNLAPEILLEPVGLGEPEGSVVGPPPVPEDELSEIADFANSEISAGREGAYFYDLVIQGIDTADVRDALKSAMTDKLFAWDVEKILRTVQSGRLELTNLTPVKTAILVGRIGALPVKIQWVQHAIASS